MQDFSILQLLRTLAAANGNATPAEPGRDSADAAAASASDAAASGGSSSDAQETEQTGTKATHARTKGPTQGSAQASEEAQAAFAYETFLSRHDRAVARIRKNRDDGRDGGERS